jgi:hypothetical protein
VRRLGISAAIAALLLPGLGCALQTVPHGRFAALTTRPAPSLGFQLDGAQRTRDVEAVVLAQHFLWVPTRTDPPTLEQAIDKALHRGNGDLLVDVEVDRVFFAIPLFYGQEGWRVRGDVIRTRPRQPAPVEPPPEGPFGPGEPSAAPGSTPPGSYPPTE